MTVSVPYRSALRPEVGMVVSGSSMMLEPPRFEMPHPRRTRSAVDMRVRTSRLWCVEHLQYRTARRASREIVADTDRGCLALHRPRCVGSTTLAALLHPPLPVAFSSVSEHLVTRICADLALVLDSHGGGIMGRVLSVRCRRIAPVIGSGPECGFEVLGGRR